MVALVPEKMDPEEVVDQEANLTHNERDKSIPAFPVCIANTPGNVKNSARKIQNRKNLTYDPPFSRFFFEVSAIFLFAKYVVDPIFEVSPDAHVIIPQKTYS
jgi:hypothetical protein